MTMIELIYPLLTLTEEKNQHKSQNKLFKVTKIDINSISPVPDSETH